MHRPGLGVGRGADARLHEPDALAATRETGELHFYSRSRGQLWRKGESSGNVMRVRALRVDCDGDALLALVDAAGPACHTGQRTCFYRGELADPAFDALGRLQRTIAERAATNPAGSYTASLLADPALAGAEGPRGGRGGHARGA